MTTSTVLSICLGIFVVLQLQVVLLAYLASRMAKLGYDQSLYELQDFARQQLQEARIAKLERRLQDAWDSEEAQS